MIRSRDFATLYAGRAVSNKNGEFAGAVSAGSPGGTNDIDVSEEEFTSYEYRNAGTLVEPGKLMEEEAPKHKTIGELIKEHDGVSGIQFSTDEHGNVQAAYIRGRHGAMKLVSMGDGLENVSSKI